MSLMSLASADLRQLVEAGYSALEAEDPEALAQQVQTVLHRLIGADVVVWNELTAEGKVSTGMTFPELDAGFWTRVAPGMLAHIHEHPFVQILGQRRCRTLTAAISDLLPTRRFVQTGLYDAGYREFGAKYQISSAIGTTDGGYLVVSLNRRGTDFSARDKAILDAVTRQAAHAYQSLRRFESLQARLRNGEGDMTPLKSSWLYIDARLIVKWGDPNLEAFLQDHFHHRRLDIFLPDLLTEVISSILARTGRDLATAGGESRVFMYQGRNYRITVVSERTDRFRVTITALDRTRAPTLAGSERLGQPLSRRETEAAYWASLGKTNPEIAIILGISSRTVEKHVHAALAKCGLENRVQLARWTADVNRK